MKKFSIRSIVILIILLTMGLIAFGTRQYYINNKIIISELTNTTSNRTIDNSVYMQNSELAYSSNRKDYESDEQFANFRLVQAGNIKNIIYRGASPVNNKNNRSQIVDSLLSKNNIKYIINLEDNENGFNDNITTNNLFNSYTYSLYNDNKVYFGNLGTNYESQEYAKRMAESLMKITKNEGPFYIHCNHGRDRTGMACMILEALADASYTEILNDYMKTFENLNLVNEETNEEKYKAIFNGRFKYAIYYITRDNNIDDYGSYDYKKAVKEYLKYGGLTESEIDELELSIKNK